MAFVLTSISGNLISAASAGFAPTNSAEVSAIASAYVDSAMGDYALSSDVSGVIDTVSSNSASWGGGGGGTGDYVEKSSTELEIGSACFASASTPYYLGSFAQGRENSAVDISVAQGRMNSAFSQSLSQGESNTASSYGFAQGECNYAEGRCLAQGLSNSAQSNSFTQGTMNTAWSHSVAQGVKNSAWSHSFAQGNQNSAKNTSVAFGVSSTAGSVSFVAGAYLTAAASAVVFGTYNRSGYGYGPTGAAFVIGNGTAEDSRHDVMVVTKDGEITMYSSTADTVGTGIMSSIRAISAAATGGGGVDSATVSAIASAYVESGVSGKLDSSAFNSADFYTTANESGYVGSAYVESSISAYQPLSGMSSYAGAFSAGDGLEFVTSGDEQVLQVEAPVDIVAGPGIVVDNPDGNTLRVSVAQDLETVLWSNDEGTDTRYITWSQQSLSEDISHFGRVKFLYNGDNAGNGEWHEFDVVSGGYYTLQSVSVLGSGGIAIRIARFSLSGTSITNDNNVTTNRQPGGTWDANSTTGYNKLYRIVGIHRIASN